MKITKIETIWFEPIPDTVWRERLPDSRQALPNNLWIRIYSDGGLVGLGETYYLPKAVSAIIHDLFAPLLIRTRSSRYRESLEQSLFAG